MTRMILCSVGLFSILSTSAAQAASYVLLAETDEGCQLYLDGTQLVASGCNVHITNGEGHTDSINGLGNLIVGYDDNNAKGVDKTGSHNVVVGAGHSYSSYGGLVAGFRNTASGNYASVSGGYNTDVR